MGWVEGRVKAWRFVRKSRTVMEIADVDAAGVPIIECGGGIMIRGRRVCGCERRRMWSEQRRWESRWRL